MSALLYNKNSGILHGLHTSKRSPMTDVQALRLPTVSGDIFAVYRKYRQNAYEILSVMRYASFRSSTGAMFQQIRTLVNEKDPKSAAKILIGIKVVGKLQLPCSDQLMAMLLDLIPVADESVYSFAGYVIAKFCTPQYFGNTTFPQMAIGKCAGFLGQKETRAKVIKQAVVIVDWMVRLSKLSSQSIGQQFVDVLTDGVFNKDAEIRERMAESLFVFVSHSRSAPFIVPVLKKAREVAAVKQAATKESVLFIYAIAAVCNPLVFKEDVGDAMALAGANLTSMKSVAPVKLLVAVAPLDSVVYLSTYRDALNAAVFEKRPKLAVVRAVLPLFRTLPNSFDDQIEKILDVVRVCLGKKLEEWADVGYSLLNELVQSLPTKIASWIQSIIELFDDIILTNAFLKVIPVFKSWNVIWENVEPKLSSKLTPSIISLLVIAECPIFSEANRNHLLRMIEDVRGRKGCDWKRYIPAALKRLQHPSMRPNHDQILKMAMTETDADVRLALLTSFEPADYPYLVTSQAMKMLMMMTSDESVEIQRAAIRIFAELQKIDSDAVVSLLRKIVTSSMYVIVSGHALKAQADASRIMPDIFACSDMLMVLYIPVIAPVMISFLTENVVPAQMRLLQRTFFERQQVLLTAAHYIKTITLTFQRMPALLDGHCSEIMKLYFSIMEGSVNKSLVLSILNSFMSILDHKGLSILEEFPSLVQCLFSLGARFSSIKVLKLLFKVFGRLGPRDWMSMSYEETNRERDTVDYSQLGSGVRYNDWYRGVIASSLLSILEEDCAKTLKISTLQVLVLSVKQDTESMRPYFDMLLRSLLAAIRTTTVDDADTYFSLMMSLIAQHSEWLKPFCGEFAELLRHYRESDFTVQIIDVIHAFVRSVRASFSPYMADLVSYLLDALFFSLHVSPEITQKVLFTCAAIAQFSGAHVDILVVKICECISHPGVDADVIFAAIYTLRIFTMRCDCARVSSLLFRVCRTCLNMGDPRIKQAAAELLSDLGLQFSAFRSQSIAEISAVLHNVEVTGPMVDSGNDGREVDDSLTFMLKFDEQSVRQSFVRDHEMVPSEWKEWMYGIVLCVITNSPEYFIRICSRTAEQSHPFSRKIFYPAFRSCWMRMSEEGRVDVSDLLSATVSSSVVPLSVLVAIVGLAEFMARTEQSLRIPYIQLARAAERAEKLPFALYCAEHALFGRRSGTGRRGRNARWYVGRRNISAFVGIERDAVSNRETDGGALRKCPDQTDEPSEVGTTLSIMSQLSMDADVKSMISSADVAMLPMLAAHLRDWRQAIEVYSSCNDDDENFLRILEAHGRLHEWNAIADSYGARFAKLPSTIKSTSAVIFATAFLHLKNWDRFDDLIKAAAPDALDTIILVASANIIRERDISSIIERGFDTLAVRAGPLFAHGYATITSFLAQAQQLVELEEFVGNRCDRWAERARSSLHAYQELYEMRLMLMRDLNELHGFLKMLRKADDWETHELYCNMFSDDHRVKYERALSLWKRHNGSQALVILEGLVESLDEDSALRRQALCTMAKITVRTDMTAEEMIRCADIAAKSDTNQAWSIFALLHAKLYYMKVGDREEHAIKSIEGFLKNAGLPEGQQMVSILVRAGKYPRVLEAVKHKLEDFPASLLLQMLPQVCAQLDNKHAAIADFVGAEIRKLTRSHHHGSIFHVLFGSFFGGTRQEACSAILDEYERGHPETLRAVRVFYKGLLTLCSTQGETWLSGLRIMGHAVAHKDAARVRETFDNLVRDSTAEESIDGTRFRQKFEDQILAVQPLLDAYCENETYDTDRGIKVALDGLYKAIKKDVDPVMSLVVGEVAPELNKLHDIDIAVPGSYAVNCRVTKVQSICGSVDVFRSKRRPKQLGIIGSDGIVYLYLLKGREDLRLDERAMQLFTLINSFIKSQIVTYFVLPLSPSGGLIQWIGNSDTILKLVSEFRKSHRIHEWTEHQKMAVNAYDGFDTLRPIQRLEALRAVAADTPDSVLADVLWLQSQSPERWLRRVSTFCKTAALMSIVGYILGLGDRHPSNLMIDREHGTVIHIDLADCFEVTRNRIHLPELIPFRLTRFLVRALGPGGVGGLFRVTCEDVMKMIRRGRESVMAVLEIFVYSPVAVQDTRKDAEWTEQALKTINRISDKLSGNDFDDMSDLTHHEQVSMLIKSATDPYNLAHTFAGWHPLW